MNYREVGNNVVIKGIGETGLINIIRDIIGYYEDNDLEYIEIDGYRLAVKIDGLSLSTSRMPFMTFYDMGWKVMASVVSDFFVKLSKPLYTMVSITLRGNTRIDDFRELIRGLDDGARHFGVRYLGGDLNEGLDDVIDVAAVGVPMIGTIGRRPRIGDFLVTIPQFGYTGLVFKLYYDGRLNDWLNLDAVKRGINMLRRPEPPINMLSELLRYGDCISASMDSSDGLGKVLWTLSTDGNVKVVVDRLPMSDDFAEEIKSIPGITIEEVVFNGGEEFLPIFSISSDCEEDFRRLGFEVFAKVEEGSGVYYGSSTLRYKGWDYFIGWST